MEESERRRQRMVATWKENLTKGGKGMVAMLIFGQKIYLSILVMEVWTRTMAGITLVIIAPPHTQPTQKSEEKMNQNTKPNKVLIWLWV